MQLGVQPVEPFRHQIQGQSVGPFYVERGDHFAVRAVHTGPFDFGVTTPVGPIEPSEKIVEIVKIAFLKQSKSLKTNKSAHKVGRGAKGKKTAATHFGGASRLTPRKLCLVRIANDSFEA